MAIAAAPRTEQSRARYPDAEGHAERDGVRIFWEVYGHGEPTILFVPAWSIIHSRTWKMQLPYLARHFRVVCFDPRGNGQSDRPAGAEAYSEWEHAADVGAVMDATGTDRALVVTLSLGAQRSLIFAGDHPERVEGLVLIGSSLPITEPDAQRMLHPFEEPSETDEGWAKYNAHYWRRDYRGFLEFFFACAFNEPHSTKQIEDAVGWGLETDPETLIATHRGRAWETPEEVRETCARIQCPSLVIHGDRDWISPYRRAPLLAEALGGRLVTIEGGGHIPNAREPVKVNLLIREFAERLRPWQ